MGADSQGSSTRNTLLRREPMDAKPRDRRGFLKESATLAGGLALGATGAAGAQTPGAGLDSDLHTAEMSKASKELVAYGERSRFVTSVRVPVAERMSPDMFGLTFHVLTPLQDSVGIITPSSLHYVATHRGSFVADLDHRQAK